MPPLLTFPIFITLYPIRNYTKIFLSKIEAIAKFGFMLENYWVGPAKGTLTVYGGIIQDERGPVGTFNGSTGQKLSGYSKNYAYDSRLLSSPPPFMPTTGDYVTLAWEEN